VNPAVKSQQDEQFFLYSATARPGNSGGPIVAQDGRVVGLVTHDLPDANQKASPSYRGVPAGEIRRALSDLGAGDLIRWEDWQF
jgi:S1-C subfamily serine protease